MLSNRSITAWAGAILIVAGLLVVLPGLAVVPDLLHTEHTHRVTTVSPDAAGGSENATDAPPVFEFENLSSAGQAAVRDGRNASDRTVTVGADGRAPEFTYDDDVATVQYVRDDGEYYQVTTAQEDRLGEAFGVGAVLLGGATAALGAVLWRRGRHAD